MVGAASLPPSLFSNTQEHPMQQVIVAVRRLVRHEEGQDLLEYGLLITLIALVAMGAVGTLGQTVYDMFWVKIGAATF
jgi:Flp pilus assembly pilin Flp